MDEKIEFTVLNRLMNKVAIITGAANGIGLRISQLFAEQGAIVIMADIDREKLEYECESIVSKRFSVQHQLCDVSNTDQVNELINKVISDHQRIDVLINNAAVAIPGNILDMSEEDWDRVFDVNLKSVFRTTRACLPHMLEQRSGSVINLSSVQAFRSWHNWTAYAAAKGAMLSMTNQLAGQFGQFCIRFNTISPGAILTPMNEFRIQSEGEDFLKQSIKMSPANRMGDTLEVANTAVFLASDEATFINGADIKVDGGLCSIPRYEEQT